ncbi:putative phosphoglycerate mutase [Paramyrothecium foliicola]|nr:putative phosphoglycerate mutase [Paramyrothecium foliicola]
MNSKWTFQAMPGVFADLTEFAAQYPRGKVPTQPRLALIPREYPTDGQEPQDARDWVRFAAYVRSLNRDAPENVSYKVLYLTRHGVGFHNQKAAEIGTELWDSYWSLQDGDGVTTWFDAFLTEVGMQQARDLGLFWKDLVDKDGAPLPEKHYTSSLARCLQTSRLAFSDLMESHGQPFRPTVKDNLRERYTLHTCDMRRPRSWIAENYPDYLIEEGMPEEDTFRKILHYETDEEHYARKQAVLSEIYSTDSNEFISLTVHSMAIQAIQAVCHAKNVHVREGSSIALLVRGERQAENA